MFQRIIEVTAPGAGLHDITPQVRAVVHESKVETGLCHLFIQHTSASLLIQESADPAVRRDLQAWLSSLAPEGRRWEHDDEGPDDMPAHARSAVTRTSETIPVIEGQLGLGTWQAIYLWEHRRRAPTRRVVLTLW